MKPIFLPAFLLPLAVHAQLVISDSFNVTGGSSVATGFGNDGINTEIDTRLGGQAAADQPLSYFNSVLGKADTAYSIEDNALVVAPLTGVGTVTFTDDGFTAFDFGNYLRGKVYEINLTMDNDTVDTVNKRFSFSIGTGPAQPVDAVPLGVQLAANADQTSAQVFKRIDAGASPGGADVNQSIAADLPYGEPVSLRIVISDVDTTLGQNSTYEIYLNGGTTAIDSGSFGIPSTNRYLIFDIAPSSGPVRYDDLSITVTGNAPEPPVLSGDRFLYFVGNEGGIYGFTGIDTGDIAVTAAANFRSGKLEATHTEYADYQAFTCDPTTGIVYGINLFGDMVTWPTVADWIANTNANVPDEGDPGYDVYGTNTIHGASYDPNTGGFYVVYEGDASIDGDIGEYATANDFTTNSNATISASTYGGNILNFYYWGEDAPGTRPAPNDAAGANYFHASGGGQLEGYQTLNAYIENADNRTFQKGGFCTGCVGAFALPMPVEADLQLRILSVTKDGAGDVTSATLDFMPQPGSTYSVLASPDLITPFAPVSGFESVTTSPVVVPVPAGFESRGFLKISENP